MKYVLFAFILALGLLPLETHAQFDFVQIVPDVCDCDAVLTAEGKIVPSAPGFGCAFQVVQNVIEVAVAIGFVLVTLMLVYAGFVWMTSGDNAERRSTGKNMLLNVIVGLVVILGAWLAVDFIMKTLYGEEETGWGPWQDILASSEGDFCLKPSSSKKLADGVVPIRVGPLADGSTVTPVTGPLTGADNKFTFQPGIEKQVQHVSPKLKSLLNCMSTRMPANVGELSSLSDSRIVSGSKTFQQCAKGGCAHRANSCHYGGTKCVGSSYAADFGDEQNGRAIIAAAKGCGAQVLDEGDHIHVSIGAASGCGCGL